MSQDIIKAKINEEFRELIKLSPNAYILAIIIASRARKSSCFNLHNLKIGESFLGDYKESGLSRQQFRTAVIKLSELNLCSFRTTNKGMVGRLSDDRLFQIDNTQHQ